MENKEFLPLETLGGMFQIAKGNEFFSSFNSYLTKNENNVFWDFFNKKIYRISDNLISFRIISHWEKEGLIENVRSEKGWRKYSLMDVIWLVTIKELRGFGLGLSEIKSVRKSLVATYQQCEYGELEFYTALAYLNRTPISILIFSNFKAEVATAYEIIESTNRIGILNHISINLNLILQNIFPEKDFKPVFDNYNTDVEQEILEALKKDALEEIKISVKNGMPINMVYTINEATDSNVGELKNKDAYQEITLKQHNGKTTAVKRVVSKKFNK